MLFKSGQFASAAGSVAGLTFQRGYGANIVRGRHVPRDRRSAASLRSRAVLARLRSYWRETMPASAREGWATYAANTPVRGELGVEHLTTGEMMFVRGNHVRLLHSGETAMNYKPPRVFGEPYLGKVNGGVVDFFNQVICTWTVSDPWVTDAGAWLFWFITRPLNGTINKRRSSFIYVGRVRGNTPQALVGQQGFPQPYDYKTGQRTFVRVVLVDGSARVSYAPEISNLVV